MYDILEENFRNKDATLLKEGQLQGFIRTENKVVFDEKLYENIYPVG